MQSPRVFVLPARSKPTSEEALLNSGGEKKGIVFSSGGFKEHRCCCCSGGTFLRLPEVGKVYSNSKSGTSGGFPSLFPFPSSRTKRELSLEASLSLLSPQTAQDCTFHTPPPFSSKSSSNVHCRGGEGERGRRKSFPMRSSAGVERGKYGFFIRGRTHHT